MVQGATATAFADIDGNAIPYEIAKVVDGKMEYCDNKNAPCCLTFEAPKGKKDKTQPSSTPKQTTFKLSTATDDDDTSISDMTASATDGVGLGWTFAIIAAVLAGAVGTLICVACAYICLLHMRILKANNAAPAAYDDAGAEMSTSAPPMPRASRPPPPASSTRLHAVAEDGGMIHRREIKSHRDIKSYVSSDDDDDGAQRSGLHALHV